MAFYWRVFCPMESIPGNHGLLLEGDLSTGLSRTYPWIDEWNSSMLSEEAEGDES
jgi:hypothetical protein